ncbi:flavin reductase family protein [Kordiimonas sp. SCSIO 12610]|uniref:flavin reductase family protein n=1 Tax=Kordiimonas sp. SCSIO 12610 TaxID=2829597 RepID=UPI00210A062B|nr:flavin reductase family protein [Kordiimonas sp. SCSIO 12610]UTW54880.1 flavin reductase family protein [Kordiimonas sp. SCSIO 12610]
MDEVEENLKSAMQSFAQNVSVITSFMNEKPHAMVASSVTSVSMSPPSMLVCINRNITMHSVMSSQKYFAINLLGSDHVDIANLCSGGAEGEQRFSAGDWKLENTKAPLLRDSISSILCERDQMIEYGSHTVFIGLVREVITSERSDTLLYHYCDYKSLS